MHNKKRILLIIGGVLFIGAVIAFGISQFYYWIRYYVFDITGEFNASAMRSYRFFRQISKGLLVACVMSIALDFLLRGIKRWRK